MSRVARVDLLILGVVGGAVALAGSPSPSPKLAGSKADVWRPSVVTNGCAMILENDVVVMPATVAWDEWGPRDKLVLGVHHARGALRRADPRTQCPDGPYNGTARMLPYSVLSNFWHLLQHLVVAEPAAPDEVVLPMRRRPMLLPHGARHARYHQPVRDLHTFQMFKFLLPAAGVDPDAFLNTTDRLLGGECLCFETIHMGFVHFSPDRVQPDGTVRGRNTVADADMYRRASSAIMSHYGVSVPGPGRGRPLVLFILRRKKRFIGNEAELVKATAWQGASYNIRFEHLESMSLVEQFRLARAATVIVGVHGAGLAWCTMMEPTSRSAVVEIVASNWVGAGTYQQRKLPRHYEDLSRAMGLQYVRLAQPLCPGEENTRIFGWNDKTCLIVNASAVASALQDLL